MIIIDALVLGDGLFLVMFVTSILAFPVRGQLGSCPPPPLTRPWTDHDCLFST